MSNALAIAAVTRTLQQLLQTGFARDDASIHVDVTTRPPDKVQANAGAHQINLFLYQTAINPSWRNMDIPWQTRSGETKPTPLPLNLYYLVTVYYGDSEEGVDTTHSTLLLGTHRLLGRAMSILHDHPVLCAEEINDALPPEERESPPYGQIERVRITPHPLSLDEISKVWTGFQTQYRLSTAYEVSVLLIESARPARAPLPVLQRGEKDKGVESLLGPFPTLEEIRRPAGARPGIQLGDLIEVHGQNLPGEDTCLIFQHARLDTLPAHLFNAGLAFTGLLDAGQLPAALRQQFADEGYVLAPEASVMVNRSGNEWTIVDRNIRYKVAREAVALGVHRPAKANVVPVEAGSTATRLQVPLPQAGDLPSGQSWPAGFYQVAVLKQCGQTQPEKVSNQLPLLLAPVLNPLDFLADDDRLARNNQGVLTLPIRVVTEVLPEQGASLRVGSHEMTVAPHVQPTADLVFRGAVPVTDNFLVVRLRVDGVDSLAFKQSNGLLVFDPQQKIRLLPRLIVKTESGPVGPPDANGDRDVPVTVTVGNQVQPGQHVALVVGGVALPAAVVPAERKVSFTLHVHTDLASVVVRLLVDGVEEPRARLTADGFVLNPGHEVNLE